MRRAVVGLVAAVTSASALCVTAPAAGPRTIVIAPGVTVTGVPLGGLTSEPARRRLRAAFVRPLTLAFQGRTWRVSPRELGAAAAVDVAVGRALRARRSEEVELDVFVRRRVVSRYTGWLSRRYARPAEDAHLAGLVDLRPAIAPERPGLAIRRAAMAERIVDALRSGDRRPIALAVRRIEPKVTRARFGPVVVIRRDSKGLYLYDGGRLVRSFGVATGQSRYPTPLGLFSVVDKQLHPWWRPPDSDWAKGLDPIPPGPGNPLGTRWMGLSAPGVGIHGTPDAASIGYSASHGCIRMRIPDAEWLFQHVTWGTPVYIVSA